MEVQRGAAKNARLEGAIVAFYVEINLKMIVAGA
jgi:hypothetical protein